MVLRSCFSVGGGRQPAPYEKTGSLRAIHQSPLGLLEIDPAEHPLQGGKQDAHRHGSADRLGHHSRQRLQEINLGGIGVEAIDQGRDHIIQQGKQDGEHHRKGHNDAHPGQGDLSGQASSQPAEEQAEQVVIHQVQHDHIDLKAEEEAPQQGKGGGDGKTRPDAVVKAEAQEDHRDDLNARQGRQSHLGGDQQRHRHGHTNNKLCFIHQVKDLNTQIYSWSGLIFKTSAPEMAEPYSAPSNSTVPQEALAFSASLV